MPPRGMVPRETKRKRDARTEGDELPSPRASGSVQGPGRFTSIPGADAPQGNVAQLIAAGKLPGVEVYGVPDSSTGQSTKRAKTSRAETQTKDKGKKPETAPQPTGYPEPRYSKAAGEWPIDPVLLASEASIRASWPDRGTVQATAEQKPTSDRPASPFNLTPEQLVVINEIIYELRASKTAGHLGEEGQKHYEKIKRRLFCAIGKGTNHRPKRMKKAWHKETTPPPNQKKALSQAVKLMKRGFKTIRKDGRNAPQAVNETLERHAKTIDKWNLNLETSEEE